MAQRRIINGGFQLPDGTPLNAGYLKLRLNTDGVVGTTQIVAGQITNVNLDANGNVSGVVNVWPNDQMNPVTVYNVKAFTASGKLAWQGQQSVPSGAGSYDLNLWVPSATS